MDRIAKRALVTGANRGMGMETCRQLARLGYQMILTGREEVSGKQTVQSHTQQGLTVLYQRLDVADPQSVQQAQRTIQAEIGEIDVYWNQKVGSCPLSILVATPRIPLKQPDDAIGQEGVAWFWREIPH